MNLFPAKPFDIDSILAIERQSFIPQIQEKRACFERRLEAFPEGFLILSDAGEEAVRAHGSALTCGYFCSERWDSLPSASDEDGAFARKFAPGHDIRHAHVPDGAYLYISSFALRAEYRGKGIGKKFFGHSLSALCGAHRSIESVVVIVSEEWVAARATYDSLGFTEMRRLTGFFASAHRMSAFRRTKADGIVMTARAEPFRAGEFVPRTENVWEGVTL